MKRQIVVLFVLTGLTWSAGTQDIYAQGVANPLGVYGMDRFVSPDVRTKGMGWAGTAAAENAGALFTNPALLTTVKSIDFRFSGSFSGVSYDQRQEWYPDKPYATLSLLFEDRLDGIVDTNSLQPRPLERGYDDIGPNWEKSNSAARPGAFVAAVPLELGGLRLVAAAGYGEAMNLDHYFQNNNALSPNIGSFQPAPIPSRRTESSSVPSWPYISTMTRGDPSTPRICAEKSYASPFRTPMPRKPSLDMPKGAVPSEQTSITVAIPKVMRRPVKVGPM